jgi:hypothetical protein
MVQQMVPQMPMQMVPQQMQTPNINIRVVAGDDNSKNDGPPTDGNNGQNITVGQPGLAGGGGESQRIEGGFDKLVIPKTESKKETTAPSILGGLAQVGTAIINKLG